MYTDNKRWERFVWAGRGIVVTLLILLVLATVSGCVSDKVLAQATACNGNQLAMAKLKYGAMKGKMDSKDIAIDTLATALAGDPCSKMVIAEINGKNALLSKGVGAAAVVAPSYFNYKKDKELYQALTGYGRGPSTVTVNAETGAGGGEGGSSGYITVNTAGGSLNTGTQTTNSFEKGNFGDGDFGDADSVRSDGLF